MTLNVLEVCLSKHIPESSAVSTLDSEQPDDSQIEATWVCLYLISAMSLIYPAIRPVDHVIRRLGRPYLEILHQN